MLGALAQIGRLTTALFREIGAITLFGWRTWRWTVVQFPSPRLLVAAMYEIGIKSLPVVVAVAMFIGMTVAIQGQVAFRQVGATGLLGMFCGLADVRELGPVLAAAMVGAKAGSQMAATLGTMRVKEQIDALEVMAIDPRSELVAPGILAIMITLPALTIITIAVSIGAALAVAVLQLGVDRGEFLSFLVGYLTAYDFFAAAFKSLFFGLIIATVSGYFGFYSERGPRGVGRATNRAVVTMCIVVITMNFALTSLLYG